MHDMGVPYNRQAGRQTNRQKERQPDRNSRREKIKDLVKERRMSVSNEQERNKETAGINKKKRKRRTERYFGR